MSGGVCVCVRERERERERERSNNASLNYASFLLHRSTVSFFRSSCLKAHLGNSLSMWRSYSDECTTTWKQSRVSWCSAELVEVLVLEGGVPVPGALVILLDSSFFKKIFSCAMSVLLFYFFAQAFSSCCEQALFFAVVPGLPIVVASLVAEHGL